MNKFHAIVEAVKHNKFQVINDRITGKQFTIAGVAQLNNSPFVVALLDAAYFTLNLVYLDKQGRPHLSKEVGLGTIKNFGGRLEESIQSYNRRKDISLPITNVVLF